jgi:hypothetical protein
VLEAYPTGRMDESLDGVDLLLVAPGLKDAEVCKAFLEAMRSTPKRTAIPVLALCASLKLALLDELSASLSWRILFEELVGQIGSALESAAVSARALLADSDHPVAQADAP